MVFSNFVMQALREQTVAQDYAVAALTRAITLAMSGYRRSNGVSSVLLFIGPSGAGKTHMSQVLARVLTGSEQTMTCLNCQQIDPGDPLGTLEAMLNQLPPQIPAPLISPATPSAFQVVVFEQIDKAPASFFDDLALAIDRGAILTPGRFFSLNNAFVILISDLSKKKADQLVGRTIGFLLDGETAVEMSRRQTAALEEVDQRLGPRLVSRLDEIVLFDRLNEHDIVTLTEKYLVEIERYLAGFCIGFILGPEAKTFLLTRGLEDLNHGARQITRVIRNYVEFPLADLMLSRRLVPGTLVCVKHKPPGNFLNFEIMIPGFASEPPAPAVRTMTA
jgi:ATP-dependent Clp protease ATP-binding subunit ClpA